ncbi:chemotaxis protein, partial [Salmonella enterica subsp. enterica serovar Weltevreden]|nr:chemotaxis protein [Salmonella enterica subsp. enterica serovar Weltevreden]
LAIHSAREAARVGDAGRGLSVNSTAVTNLTADATHSSKSVSTLTTVNKEKTATVSEVLDNQQPVIDKITTNINQIVESIGILIEK